MTDDFSDHQTEAHFPADPDSGRPRLRAHNPATGQLLRAYHGHTREEALAIARRAHEAFKVWRKAPFSERATMMKAAAACLRRRKEEFAALMTAEMGKTRTEGLGEIEKCALNCDTFADHAERMLAREAIEWDGPKAFVTFNPLGAILAIMPWNFPFWQVFRFAAPSLMAGNAAVLKHASNVPGCALAIEDVFREAGFPANVFSTVLIPSHDVEALIANPAIAAVTLTGSVAAGQSVAAAAGRNLKKCVLELGGSDPYLILEDADIERAAVVSTAARMVNGGQSCIAGKRFIVVSAVRRPSKRRSRPRCTPSRWAIPATPTQSLARSSASRPAMPFTARFRTASPKARSFFAAAKSPTSPARGIRRPCSAT